MCYDLSLTCISSSNSVELQTQDNVKSLKCQCQPLPAAWNWERYSIHLVEVLSVEITCLWRLLVSTDNTFHLILGFNSSTQTTVFTLNQDSRKGNLYRQWFSPWIWFHKKVIYTDNSSNTKVKGWQSLHQEKLWQKISSEMLWFV